MSESGPRWNVIFTRQAEMALHRLSRQVLQDVDRAILALAENPRPPDCQELIGDDNLYRLGVGEWRITYAVEENRLTVLVLEITPKQRPERYRLTEEMEQAPWSEEAENPDQASSTNLEEMLRANLLYHAFKRLREGGEFFDLAKFIRQSVFDLTPQVRENLYKFKEELEEALAKLTDTEKRERQNNPERIRVLIVDDVAETRENLRKLLSFESDIEVVGAATSGEEAIQMTVERQPDIVLMDLLLPSIDGIAATERILQLAPSAKVIMMSVQGEADVFRRAMLAGAKEFLIKPFSSDELVSSLRRVYQPARMGRAKHEDYASHLMMMMADSTWKKLLLATPFEFFKQQKLGHSVEIGLAVADLSKSLCFYQQLGLEEVERGERPYPWVMLSDGLLHMGLYQDVFPSPTINYFIAESRIPVGSELVARALHLQQLGTELDKVQPFNNNLLDMRRFKRMLALGQNPEYTVDSVEFRALETLPVRLSNFRYWIREMKTSRKLPGLAQKFGELSLKTKDVSAAVAYWEQLGFQQVARNDKPYPSAIVSDGLIRLGLHQTSKFTKPTITYFAPDMPQRLERLREQGIEFISEQKDARGQRVGAMIESPDGQPFFLFTGEIKV